MSSENRSSSAVRNLRSLFENKHGDTTASEPRGRSPAGSLGAADSENGGLRRTSKVRASFVSVEPRSNMATLQPSESSAGRRGSFGEADASLELKKSISNSQESAGPETAVSSVAGTPNLKPQQAQVGQQPRDNEAENPDKPVTGEEEEPLDMKPADPASAEAVSGGQALPPVAEDLRKSTSQKADAAKSASKKPTVNGTGKPAAISTKAPSKPAASSVKSPASAKTPTSATSASKPAETESPKAQPAKAPLKKPSRSSLTAPTAASMARSGPSDKGPSAATSRPKPRETTKPISLPSHLTAPTASSRAKHEPEATSKPATNNLRSSTTSTPKSSTTTAKPSRSSLAPEHRPGSRTSQTSRTRRSVAPADGSFLERMMKPTAASASKTQEKTEVKSPPRQKAAAPSRPKTNGTAARGANDATKKETKRTSEGSSTTAPAPLPSEVPVGEQREEASAASSAELASKPSVPDQKEAAPEPVNSAATQQEPIPGAEPTSAVPNISDPSAGNSTPQAAGETAIGSAGLEATSAGLGSDGTIR